MDALNKVNRSIIKKVKIIDAKNDFEFWQNQPYEVRLAALENIRQEYIRWKYGSDPGFQRVCTIIKKV